MMAGRDGGWSDPDHPCHGPVDACLYDTGDRPIRYSSHAGPPVPAFISPPAPVSFNQAATKGPETSSNPMDRFRQVWTIGIMRNVDNVREALMHTSEYT